MSRYDSPGLEAGSWGEFFSALEHMTTRLQSSKFNSYEQGKGLVEQLQKSAIDNYNSAMAQLMLHTSATGGIHKVSAMTTSLGLVDNIAAATLEQITSGGFDDLYITADGFSTLAAKVFGDFSTKLHSQGINPISTYGDISWLPPDVSGSFEGAGMAGSGDAGGFSLIEDDGTWIGLRRGTNGTSQGLYYFYLSNAEDRIDSVGPVRMNLRYSPANRPSGFECLDTISSDVGVIVGQGYGHATYNGFVSLTNGTMDVTKHYTGYFNIQTAFGRGITPHASACVVGNYVYLFIPVSSTSWQNVSEVADPYDIDVYRCPTSQIISGGAVTWEAMKSWNSTGLWGNTGVSDSIRVAPTMLSVDPAKKPFILHENRAWTTVYSPIHSGRRTMCCVDPNNVNQVRLAVYHTVWSSLANGTSLMPNIGFSVLVNVAGKTAVVEDGANYIKHVSPNQNTLQLQSNAVITADKITGFNYAGNYWPNTLVTARGYLLSRGSGNQADETNRFIRAELSNFANRFDALRIGKRVIRPLTNIPDPIRVGSQFTNNAMNPRMLPGLNLLFNGTTTAQTAQWTYGRVKRLQFMGDPTFNYGTINSGVIKGWAPNSTRMEFPNNIAFNQGVFITRTGSDGSLVCDASVMSGPSSLSSAGASINKDLVISGSFNWQPNEGNNVALSAARQILGKQNINQYAWVIYVPQDANLPVLMVLSATTARDDSIGFRATIALVELTYNGSRSGAIAGYTLKRIIKSPTWEQMPGGAYTQFETMAGIQSYKCADGTYIMSIGVPTVLGAYGGQTGWHWYAAVKPGAKTIEDSSVKEYSHGYFPTSALPSGFVHPSYGLCMLDYQTNQANYSAIMAINVMATTYDEFVAWQPKQKLIIGAQEVEQGWIVYFTADAPVFLAGREYTLPATAIDLRSIDSSPGNKTFYAYVRLTVTGIEYFLTTTPSAPTITMMYIGRITTIASQISTIQISKRVRVDTFELSAPHIGSAIPISTGVPSGSGNFVWFPAEFTQMLFRQYDTSGTQRAATNDFDINFIDIALGNSAAISNATIDIAGAENTGNNQGQRFSYSGSQNGAYAASIRLTGVNVPVNGTVRIWVRVNEVHDRDLRVTANFTATLTYGSNRMVRTCETFGYQLRAINNPDVSFEFFDDAGNSHGTANDFEIGAIDIIYNPGWAMNGVAFYVRDTQSQDNFLYSESLNGPWGASVSYNANIAPGGRKRIYVRRVNNNDIDGRLVTQLLVDSNYTNGVNRSTGSPAYGFRSYAKPTFNDRPYIRFAVTADFIVATTTQMSSGAVIQTVSKSGKNISGNNTDLVTGQVWNPGFNYTGGSDDSDHYSYNDYRATLPGLVIPNLSLLKSASARIVSRSGRSPVTIEQQPSAANGWAISTRFTDEPGGVDYYEYDIYLTLNW